MNPTQLVVMVADDLNHARLPPVRKFEFDDLFVIHRELAKAKRRGKMKRVKHLLFLRAFFWREYVIFGFSPYEPYGHVSRLSAFWK